MLLIRTLLRNLKGNPHHGREIFGLQSNYLKKYKSLRKEKRKKMGIRLEKNSLPKKMCK